MSDRRLVRRAGTGASGGGETVWWSVAEGRRGRRWREAVVGDQGVRHVLLLETAPDARFSHLELASRDGLLTLHPEGDGTLHGNVLTAAGLRHVIGVPWAPDGLVVVEGSPVTLAAVGQRLAQAPAGTGRPRRILRISSALTLEVDDVPVVEESERRWRLGADLTVTAGEDGLPSLEPAASWPMELDG